MNANEYFKEVDVAEVTPILLELWKSYEEGMTVYHKTLEAYQSQQRATLEHRFFLKICGSLEDKLKQEKDPEEQSLLRSRIRTIKARENPQVDKTEIGASERRMCIDEKRVFEVYRELCEAKRESSYDKLFMQAAFSAVAANRSERRAELMKCMHKDLKMLRSEVKSGQSQTEKELLGNADTY